jgi:DNA modification methylase
MFAPGRSPASGPLPHRLAQVAYDRHTPDARLRRSPSVASLRFQEPPKPVSPPILILKAVTGECILCGQCVTWYCGQIDHPDTLGHNPEMAEDWNVVQGDVLTTLPTLEAESVHCCVTSPPYWGLRDYGVEGQLGLEPTPDEYVAKMVAVFREVRRVLRDDGTLWLNLGDSYAATTKGSGGPDSSSTLVGTKAEHNGQRMTPRKMLLGSLKPKDLVGIPWRVAFALQADGWYLRQDIIWHKPNPMPESVRDRCTKAHEYIFLLAKSERYYYDAEAVGEETSARTLERDRYTRGGNNKAIGVYTSGARKDNNTARHINHSSTRNRRSVWTVTTKPYKGAHFATFPPKLIEPCILAGCPVGGTVLDPFTGSGTTGAVALEHGRKFVGVELNGEYIELAKARIGKVEPRLV